MKCIRALFSRLVFAALSWPFAVVAADAQTPATGGMPKSAVPMTAQPGAPLSGQSVGGSDYLQVFLGLFLVVGLIVALAWAARRFGRFNVAGAGALRILGGLSMGQRERIVLVQVGEEQLLLGVAPGQVQTLHVLSQPITPPEPGKAGGAAGGGGTSFAERLSAALKGGQRS